MGIESLETLAAGHELHWTRWKSLNRLDTGYGRAVGLMNNYRYGDNPGCTIMDTVTTQDAPAATYKLCSIFLNVKN